jgi:hypothetical protein
MIMAKQKTILVTIAMVAVCIILYLSTTFQRFVEYEYNGYSENDGIQCDIKIIGSYSKARPIHGGLFKEVERGNPYDLGITIRVRQAASRLAVLSIRFEHDGKVTTLLPPKVKDKAGDNGSGVFYCAIFYDNIILTESTYIVYINYEYQNAPNEMVIKKDIQFKTQAHKKIWWDNIIIQMMMSA